MKSYKMFFTFLFSMILMLVALSGLITPEVHAERALVTGSYNCRGLSNEWSEWSPSVDLDLSNIVLSKKPKIVEFNPERVGSHQFQFRPTEGSVYVKAGRSENLGSFTAFDYGKSYSYYYKIKFYLLSDSKDVSYKFNI